jgi:hypothetical protein
MRLSNTNIGFTRCYEMLRLNRRESQEEGEGAHDKMTHPLVPKLDLSSVEGGSNLHKAQSLHLWGGVKKGGGGSWHQKPNLLTYIITADYKLKCNEESGSYLLRTQSILEEDIIWKGGEECIMNYVVRRCLSNQEED